VSEEQTPTENTYPTQRVTRSEIDTGHRPVTAL